MSSVKSAGLDKPLIGLPVREIRSLAPSIPVQKYGDSPTVKHYTDWSKLLVIETTDNAERSVSGLLREALNPTLVLSPEGVENRGSNIEVEELVNTEDYRWSIPVENRLQAIHAYRWYRGARVTVVDDAEITIYLSPGDGYTGYHLELNVMDQVKTKITLAIDNTNTVSPQSSSVLVRAGKGSNVELATIEKSTGASYHYKHVIMAESANVKSRILASGGDMTRLREDYILNGENGLGEIHGSSISTGSERLDLIINTIHKAPNTASTLRTRGIVSGRAVVAHRGVARVYSSAEMASVDVESFLYVTSRDARAYSVPVLEVDTGIVESARHSTAVMDIPGEIEFYLRQRGLDRRDIIRLISHGLLEIVEGYVDLGVLERVYL